MRSYLKSFWTLIAPDLCPGCQEYHKPEKSIFCPLCQSTLTFSRTQDNAHQNELIDKFDCKDLIDSGAALYNLDENSVLEKVIYDIKYNGREDLAIELGETFARRLKKKDILKNVDVIIPVPLHKKKLKHRGFNQSQAIAKGISGIMNLEVKSDVLIRVKNTKTQTDMTKAQRLLNVKDAFIISRSVDLSGLHILLIDDVVTTGATCTACIEKLIHFDDIKVSVACVALPVDI